MGDTLRMPQRKTWPVQRVDGYLIPEHITTIETIIGPDWRPL